MVDISTHRLLCPDEQEVCVTRPGGSYDVDEQAIIYSKGHICGMRTVTGSKRRLCSMGCVQGYTKQNWKRLKRPRQLRDVSMT